MSTKLGGAMTYHDSFPPLKSHDPLITWPICFYLTTSKKCISGPINLVGWWLQGGHWKRKRLVRFQFLFFFFSFSFLPLFLDKLTKVFFTNISLIVIEELSDEDGTFFNRHIKKSLHKKMFLKLLFATDMAHDIPWKKWKPCKSADIYSHRYRTNAASRICCNITIFVGTFMSPLPQQLWPPNLPG